MGALIPTLMSRKFPGNVPEMLREMLLFLAPVPDHACSRNLPRPVPGTFLEGLFLEHAPKLPGARKGEAYELRG